MVSLQTMGVFPVVRYTGNIFYFEAEHLCEIKIQRLETEFFRVKMQDSPSNRTNKNCHMACSEKNSISDVQKNNSQS